MSIMLGYFKKHDAEQSYTPSTVRESLGSQNKTAANCICCLGGGNSLASSSDTQMLPDGLHCIFAGQLINKSELWEEFKQDLPREKTTDAMLCLLLFTKYGIEFVRRLNGPFCVAVAQESKGRLWLYRDQLGQQPCYFCHLANGYTFFSDNLAVLRRIPGTPSKVSLKGLSDFLSLGYIPSPWTIYENISKLLPGSYLELSAEDGKASIHRFWRPTFAHNRHISFQDAAAETRMLVQKAVDRCLEEQPKTAVLLSGGIDSNLVMALCAKAKKPVNLSYTVGFAETAYDERALALCSAAHMQIINRQHEILPNDWSILRDLQKLNGEPFGDSSIIPTTIAMQQGIGQVDCMFTGSGGDELFGGYRRYQALCWRRLTRWLPDGLVRGLAKILKNCLPGYDDARTRLATIRRFADFMSKSSMEGYLSFQEIFSRDMKQTLLSDQQILESSLPLCETERLLDMSTSDKDIEHFNELDILTYLPDDGGQKEFLAGMYSGMQHLCPLLDIEIAEFALSLPWNMRVTTKSRKLLLREIGKTILCPELLKQTKRGFGMPVSAWLRNRQTGLLQKLVRDLPLWDKDGWFNPKAIQKMSEEHIAGKQDHGPQLWNLLCLQEFFK